MGQLALQLTPFIIELINEYRHRNDQLTPEIVTQRLQKMIDSGELKIDQAVADILSRKNN